MLNGPFTQERKVLLNCYNWTSVSRSEGRVVAVTNTRQASMGRHTVLTHLPRCSGNTTSLLTGNWKLSEAEAHYTIVVKECLSCVVACLEYYQYIVGAKFYIRTNHSTLKWLINHVDLKGRLFHWILTRHAYEAEILRPKGSSHKNAYGLSRSLGLSGYANTKVKVLDWWATVDEDSTPDKERVQKIRQG